MSVPYAHGYRTETPYPLRFHRELNPRRMALVLAAQGLAAPDFDEPYAYMELGFGQGLSLVMLAAANPQAQFYGVDIMPEHVEHAQGLARAAGLTNLHLRQLDLVNLVPSDWPSMDVIAAHGVWSWVGPDVRSAAMRFIDARLKPGGLLYLSYNVRAGWAAMAPIRDMMKQAFDAATGSLEDRVKQSVAAVRAMEAAKAVYFRANPTVSVRLQQMKGETAGYLAHEFLNEAWQLYDVSEVATALEASGLSYAGSAQLQDNVTDLTIRAEARSLFQAQGSLIAREALKDILLNKQFRRDIYVRSPRVLNDAELSAAHFNTRFVAQMTPEQLNDAELKTEIMTVKLNSPVHAALVAALQQQPRTLREALSSPGLSGFNPNAAFGTAFLLCALRALAPAAPARHLASVDALNAELDRRNTTSVRVAGVVGGGWA